MDWPVDGDLGDLVDCRVYWGGRAPEKGMVEPATGLCGKALWPVANTVFGLGTSRLASVLVESPYSTARWRGGGGPTTQSQTGIVGPLKK